MLPAASQYEKWECTFFNLEFPHNVYHLRRPIFEPLEGTLPEYEIHSRLCHALGAYTDDDIAPLREAAGISRAAFADTFINLAVAQPRLGKLAAVLLYETMGPTLTTPDGEPARGAAAVWGLAQRCALGYADSIRRAGIGVDATSLGDALFDAISRCSARLDLHDRRVRGNDASPRTTDKKISLSIPRLWRSSHTPGRCGFRRSPGWWRLPVRARCGERRSSTADTIQRDPAWHKKDAQGALRVWSKTPNGSAWRGYRTHVTTDAAPPSQSSRITGHVRRVTSPCRTASVWTGRLERCRSVSPPTSSPRRMIATGSPALRITSMSAPASRRSPCRVGPCQARQVRRLPCPIARTTDLIGDWSTPLIMRVRRPATIDEFQSALDTPRAVLLDPAEAAV